VANRPLRLLLIALGLLIAQGPMLLHLLLVQHETCEHGELVEVPVGARVAASRPAIPAAARANGSPTLSEGAVAPGGHDHCDALAVRHRIPDVGPAIAAASLVWIAPIAAGGERAEVRAVPLLSLAPKGSPPALR
jgi:hypothetical protein